MTDEPDIDPLLKQWATPRQAEIIDALNLHGSARKAAAALGVSCHRALVRAVRAVKTKAASAGYSPEHDMTRTAPHPFLVRGVSTYYDKEGEVRGQWVKTRLDDDAWQAAVREAVSALCEDIPRAKPIAAPPACLSSLCNLYTMTDCHMGMLAWHKEGGDDWDITIAERVLTGCFEQMVVSAPPAKVGIVNQLGDFLHTDGLSPVTPSSGHILDTDGRFSKIVGATVRVLRQMVTFALTRHEQVFVIMAEGNHDMASSVWLRVIFKALYENEPRVTVIDSELPYYAHQHGKTMLAFHHGHMKKNEALPLLFASQYPQMWGATTKRYAHTGHRHHEETKEHSGMRVTQHPTLAARDAYAARGGWISERQATAFTYHEDYGQVGSVTVVPEMLT